MKLKKQKVLVFLLTVLIVFAGCAGKKRKEVNLTFLTWDRYQTPGMEAMIAAYTAKNPGISISVQTTGWDEYWTKLEAAATGNTLPDIFWMHTNELLKYAGAGILADLTHLYDDVSPGYYREHFSEVSLKNAGGIDGKIYGVPKDKDTIGLVYNKEMFDAAKVSYPDEHWTWNDLIKASRTIHKATGKYGYMAYLDDQVGYWNFVYQAGGYILNEDGTKAGFTDPGTKKAIKFYWDIQKEAFCPDQKYFAETSPGTAFFSGLGAMYFEGNWNLKQLLDNYPGMVGKWDVAVLPKCPDPVRGDGRASISNGLCYSTGARGKNLNYALEFLKFLGTKEAMIIQGESGAAIPAYAGTEQTYFTAFDKYAYRIAIEKYFDMFSYGVQSVNNKSRPVWKPKVQDEMLKLYSGKEKLETVLANMQKIVDEASAK
ncbi:MAG: sugar ABC transporter substrate-binding protein [Treponema sp.]|nr:sugar ABC transporter substrate-binding protein [Treponema sp.]